MKNISALREQIKLAESPEEKEAFEDALSLEVAALKKINSAERATIAATGDLEMDVEAGAKDEDL